VAGCVNRLADLLHTFLVAGRVDRLADRVALVTVAGVVHRLAAGHGRLRRDLIVHRLAMGERMGFPDHLANRFVARLAAVGPATAGIGVMVAGMGGAAIEIARTAIACVG